eukprot:CAMPEP_0179087984 /NCGR_PEP_ID=MMETSP0796-20121207/40005_1 /TAXON_ID=73915 /ORGANISM="Pyrodinium bahamense, Strain pbaha01" /LENGTH=539 /DNA_ID=CAMNT_0020785499 /DNA_START=60 /DNA_END=1679 /DNA_ORIENTATION=+
MAGVGEELAPNEEDKGPLVYQESKIFHGETFLCNVYDNTKRKYVTFEIYGLDTQDILTLGYDYNAFDKEFRFNAELMNPNRKEGRFHWVIERLAVVTVGKERKLERKPEPSEEVPELPIYETTRKIPTGRMDLKERQRLRDQMDMLDTLRAENIAKKRALTKEKFLKHITRVKEEDARKKKEVEEKIRLERQQRIKTKEEQDKLDQEEQLRLEAQDKVRRKSVMIKEQRTEEQDEEEYRLLRERWRVLDAEKAANTKEAHDKKEAERAAARQTELEKKERLAELQAQREEIWRIRDSRVARKEADMLKRILGVKAELQRQDRMRKERNQEFIKVLHMERQPIFREQLKRTQQRQLAQDQEKEAVATYIEKRSIPKKVKTKGKYAKPKEAVHDKANPQKAKGKTTKKGDRSKDDDKSEAETEKDRTDRVLDAVEAKVRAEMAEEQRLNNLNNQRMDKISSMEQARLASEVKHMKQYREACRQRERKSEEAAAERHLIMKQRDDERKSATERKRQEQERLQRVREHNIARREQERLAALCA